MSLSEKIHILLVDDHPENLLALGAILETPSYNIIKALSGQEALKCLLYQDFAVIVLDVQMPGMDGFETAAMIRERKRSRHTPIIFLTAHDPNRQFVTVGYQLGAVDYLFKPVVAEILQSKIAVFAELFEQAAQIKQQAAQLAVVSQQLAAENIQRRIAEQALQLAKDELENIIAQRTQQLRLANEQLVRAQVELQLRLEPAQEESVNQTV